MAPISSTATSNLFLPDSHFVGRENFLKQLHITIVERDRRSNESTNPLTKMTVIHGPDGIGKSSVALKYMEEYQNYFKYIIWINAATEDSIIDSFLVVAQNWKICPLILEKRCWTAKLAQLDVVSLVSAVYRHFDQNFKTGLFIFDGAQRLEGIQEFLPKCDVVSNFPNFLVTSSSSSSSMGDLWRTSDTEVKVMEIGPLDPEEGFKFLNKSLGVKSDGNGQVRQGLLAGFAVTKLSLFIAQGHLLILPGVVISGFDLLKLREFHDSIRKLVTILQGHPLALHLARCAINVNWSVTGFSLTRYKVLNGLVKNYIKIVQLQLNGMALKNVDEPDITMDKEWEILTNGVQTGDIIDAILTETVNHMLDSMNNIKREEKETKSLKKIIKTALHLFNIISHLPADNLSVELCHAVINNINFNQQYLLDFQKEEEKKEEKNVKVDHSEKIELTRNALKILNQYGIILISNEPIWSPSVVLEEDDANLNKITPIKVHSWVQKWRRDYVRKSETGFKCLVEDLQNYFETNEKNSVLNHQLYLNCIRHHLDE